LEQLTRARIVGNDYGLRAALDIETQLGFPVTRVGAVAAISFVGKDGPDIAVELDVGRSSDSAARKQGEPRQSSEGHPTIMRLRRNWMEVVP
jgi:hypothetical protein